MKLTSGKTVFALVLAAYGVSLAAPLAAQASHYECWYDHWGHRRCRTVSDPADGFLAGLLIGMLSVFTTFDAANHAYSETLVSEAAVFHDTGVKGAVFSAFAANLYQEVALQAGKQVSELPVAELDQIVANDILAKAE